MATVTHKVVKGDTLSAIAKKYGTTVDAIAKLNGIKNVNLIYVGQVLTISGATASTATTTKPSTPTASKTTTSTSSNVATITSFGLQAGSDRTVFAMWSWGKSNTDKYEILWHYITSDGKWFVGNQSTTEQTQSTYNGPNNAVGVAFAVRPVSETKTVNQQQVSYWTAQWSTAKTYYYAAEPPDKPPTPSVTIDEYKLTAKVSNYSKGTEVQFEVVQNDSKVYKTGTASVITDSATFSCTIEADKE